MNQDQYISWIWHEFADSHNHHCRKYLIKYYLPLVQARANFVYQKCFDRFGPRVSIYLGDFVQKGLSGLQKAVDSFEPDGEVDFETFSKTHIHQAIIDDLKSNYYWIRHKVRKYTRNQLVLIALDVAYANYFYCVDSKGNPVKERYSDFDYFSLSEVEQEMYDEFYDWSCHYLEKEYEKETKESGS